VCFAVHVHPRPDERAALEARVCARGTPARISSGGFRAADDHGSLPGTSPAAPTFNWHANLKHGYNQMPRLIAVFYLF
jgi:hypothetical protein